MAEKIYPALISIKRNVGAIEKGRKYDAAGTKFNYRGTDDVIDVVFPLLNEFGVILVPKVLEVVDATSGKTNPTPMVRVRCEFRFYAEDGSFVECITVGQAQAASDKAATAAQSVATRIALCQTLTIPYEMTDPEDLDMDSQDRRNRSKAATAFLSDLSTCISGKALIEIMKLAVKGVETGTGMSRAEFGSLEQDVAAAARKCKYNETQVKEWIEKVRFYASGGVTDPVGTEGSTPAEKAAETPTVTAQSAESILTALMAATNRSERESAVISACQSVLNGLDVASLAEVADACKISDDTSVFFFGAILRAQNSSEISGTQDQINSAEITTKAGKIGKEVANALRQFAQFRLKGLA
jgi:hypothetical protein